MGRRISRLPFGSSRKVWDKNGNILKIAGEPDCHVGQAEGEGDVAIWFFSCPRSARNRELPPSALRADTSLWEGGL